MPEPSLDASPPPGDAALDTAADALAWHILGRLPAARSHGRTALAALPSPVARLLLARLDARIDREAPTPSSEWLDPDEVTAGARAWRDAARGAARVPAPEWAGFLGEACRLVVSHLVRPAETLAAYAFADAATDEIPAAIAIGRLRSFEAYPYLPEIANRYVVRKEVSRIDRPELERLLRRIDRRMVVGFGVDEWATLLDPLVSLLGPVSPAGGVPAALLAPFFEAKGQDELAATFTGDWVYSSDTLYQALTHVVQSGEASPERPAQPSDGAAETTASPDGAERPDGAESREKAEPAPTPPANDARPGDAPLDDEAPDTEAPDTEAPDTEAPDTEAPGAQSSEQDDDAVSENESVGGDHSPAVEPAAASPDTDAEANRAENRPDDDAPQADRPERDSDAGRLRDVPGDDPTERVETPTTGAVAGAAPSPADSDPEDGARTRAAAVSGWLAEMAEAPAETPPTPEADADADPEAGDRTPPVETPPVETPPAPRATTQEAPRRRRAEARTTSALRAPWTATVARLDLSVFDPPRAMPPVAPLAFPEKAADAPAPPEPEATPEPAESEPEPLWKRAMSRSARPAEDASAAPEARTGEALWKRFVGGARPVAAEPDVPVPPVAPPRARLPESDGRGDDAALSTDLDRIENRALIGTTDLARREWFVDELFSGSGEDYRQTLVALAAAPTWTVAAEILGEVFRAHRVNVYSDPALAFTDAAEARFRR